MRAFLWDWVVVIGLLGTNAEALSHEIAWIGCAGPRDKMARLRIQLQTNESSTTPMFLCSLPPPARLAHGKLFPSSSTCLTGTAVQDVLRLCRDLVVWFYQRHVSTEEKHWAMQRHKWFPRFLHELLKVDPCHYVGVRL